MTDRGTKLCFALAILVSVGAQADSVLVPNVELREREAGRYWLDAFVAAEVVSRVRAPAPPDRCSVGAAEREDHAVGFRVRFAIECGDVPLGRRDVIVLPWTVDGAHVTAFWLDGATGRALFGHEPAGVVVRLRRLLDRDARFVERASELWITGWSHFWASASHLVFFLALALLVRDVPVALGGLALGSALALVLAELGLVGLPLVPADAAYAGASTLLMASFVRDGVDRRGLFAMTALLGALHGLGMATAHALPVASGSARSALVEAVFFINAGIDLAGAVFAGGAALVWNVLTRRRARSLRPHRRAPLEVAGLVGVAGIVLALATIRDGVSRTASAEIEGSEYVDVQAFASAQTETGVSRAAVAQPSADGGELASPFMSYLIVEPYQVRHEVLVQVKTLSDWIELPVDASMRVPVAAQATLADEIATLVSARAPVRIDGERAVPRSRRGDFVVVTPAGALSRERAIPEPLETAVVGVTLVFAVETLADAVELQWELFSTDVTTVPVTWTDPSATAGATVSADAPRVEWRNRVDVRELPSPGAITAAKPRLPLASLALGACALVATLLRRRRWVAVVCWVAAYVVYPFARVEAFIPFIAEARFDVRGGADSEHVVEGLLTNVYRAFDIHDEERIYDRLALSVTGDALVDVYLESRRALEIENSGGARVRIDDVVVREVSAVRESGDGGYELEARWTVSGSVNHFGHIHFRQNQYDATLVIVPVDDAWKIRSIDSVDEKRIL